MGTIGPAAKPRSNSPLPLLATLGAIGIAALAWLVVQYRAQKPAAAIGDRGAALMDASRPAEPAQESRDVAEAYIKACLVSDVAAQRRLAPGLGHPIVFSARFVRDGDRLAETVAPAEIGPGWGAIVGQAASRKMKFEEKPSAEADDFKRRYPVFSGLMLSEGGWDLFPTLPHDVFTVYAYGYVYDVELQSQAGTKLRRKTRRLEDLPLTEAQLGTLEEVEADLECLEADAADAEREAARTKKKAGGR